MASVAMSRVVSPPMHATASRSERLDIGRWFVGGAVIVFLFPHVGAGLLELHHDLYLLVYLTVAGTFLASFAANHDVDWRGWLRTRMWWSVGAGALVALAIVRKVLSDPSMVNDNERRWRVFRERELTILEASRQMKVDPI
jgi:hypothetical protein